MRNIAAAAPDPGFGGSIVWLRLEILLPHPKAQRAFDEAWARRIAENFDPDAFGVVQVVRNSGRHYVVDGAHRVAAAKQVLGERQLIPCEVHEGADLAKAADLFLKGNDRRGVHSIDKFWNRVHRGDEAATAILQTLQRYRLTVSRGGVGARTVSAIAACESVYRRSANMFRAIVEVLHQAWGDEPDAYHGSMIRGLELVLTWNPDIEPKDLGEKLAAYSKRHDIKAGTILGRAKALRESEAVTGLAAGVADAVITIWNKSRKTRRAKKSTDR